jgi:hypothetical protein
MNEDNHVACDDAVGWDEASADSYSKRTTVWTINSLQGSGKEPGEAMRRNKVLMV